MKEITQFGGLTTNFANAKLTKDLSDGQMYSYLIATPINLSMTNYSNGFLKSNSQPVVNAKQKIFTMNRSRLWEILHIILFLHRTLSGKFTSKTGCPSKKMSFNN